METKFTKGNWKQGDDTSKDWNFIFVEGRIKPIAEIVPLSRPNQRRPNDFTEEDANAKLIAAAPKLYEALQLITSKLSNKWDWTESDTKLFIQQSESALKSATD